MLLHHAAEKTEKWIGGWNIDTVAVMPFGMLVLLFVGLAVDPDAVVAAFAAFIATSPLWLPVFLFAIFWVTWIHYVRYKFWFKTDMTLLHIELPPEVSKSPAAIEIFLSGLWNTGGETTFINRFLEGKGRPIWSLEIASDEGRIGFYLHLRKIMRDVVEAKIYGQFPEARISEVEDYVTKVPFNLEEYDMWCGEYKKSAKDSQGRQADAVPIKTYVDYELNMNADTPETKTDPLTNVLELLGTRGPGEHLWIQIIMRAHAPTEDYYGFQVKRDTFIEPGRQFIKDIVAGAIARAQELTKDPVEREKVGSRGATLLTQGERDFVNAIERQTGKLVFQCGIRCLYIGKREIYRGITGASTFRLFDSFRSGGNELRGTRGMVGFDYPWEDFRQIRKNFLKKLFFFHYKYRAYFYVPYDQVPVHLTTEEVASLWHFPNSEVRTPALQRVPSRRSEAPANLPF
jgi:hypothetical protein